MSTREIPIRFGAGMKVIADIKGFAIESDQPAWAGGEGTVPAPFDLFLASLATCAGYYVLAFCREREIPIEDITMSMVTERGAVSKMIDKITFIVDLPPSFPEKYKFALGKAIDHCSVKVHMIKPPRFETVARTKS